MAGRERGLQGVRPVGTAERLGTFEGGKSAADQQMVPAGAVLFGDGYE